MWHASVAYHGRVRPDWEFYAMKAARALQGVGDWDLGQWSELGATAWHLRRRLSETEQAGLEVRDIRGTPEAALRLAPLRHLLPAGYTE